MTPPTNRAMSPAAPPGRGLLDALTSVLGSKPAPAPNAPPPPRIAPDRLEPAPGYGALASPEVRSALARLITPGGSSQVSPQGWRALAEAWQLLGPRERAPLAARLAAAGVTAAESRDGRFVQFRDATITAVAEPGADKLRVQRPGRADCYLQGQLVETISYEGSQITLESSYGTEVWTTNGEGTLNGRPIGAGPAPRVPGEAPRLPQYGPRPQDDLEEPAWLGTSWMETYGPEYDDAIEEAGGDVIVPYNAAADIDTYNCHSFGTTYGQGDLFDPFLRLGQPHWLDNPMRQLASGGFGKLAPDQRVHPGDLVVYRNNGAVTHTGVVAEVDAYGNPTRIESKFGMLGVYEHDTYDVANGYGTPAEFYRPAGT